MTMQDTVVASDIATRSLSSAERRRLRHKAAAEARQWTAEMEDREQKARQATQQASSKSAAVEEASPKRDPDVSGSPVPGPSSAPGTGVRDAIKWVMTFCQLTRWQRVLFSFVGFVARGTCGFGGVGILLLALLCIVAGVYGALATIISAFLSPTEILCSLLKMGPTPIPYLLDMTQKNIYPFCPTLRHAYGGSDDDEHDQEAAASKQINFGKLIAPFRDEVALSAAADAMITIVMSDPANREANVKARERVEKQYRKQVYNDYVRGTDMVSAHVRQFVASLATTHTSMGSLVTETKLYPAASKPKCNDWSCWVKVQILGTKYMVAQGEKGLGPVNALRRRAGRALETLESLRRAGDAMVTVVRDDMPSMDGEVCSEWHLKGWEEKWAEQATKMQNAQADLRLARQEAQEVGDKRKWTGEEERKRLLGAVQLWEGQVSMLLKTFGKARLQSADLGNACAEFKPYKTTVQKLVNALNMGTRGYVSTRDLIKETATTIERILDEVKEWDGTDLKEINLWEVRLLDATKRVSGHVEEVYLW